MAKKKKKSHTKNLIFTNIMRGFKKRPSQLLGLIVLIMMTSVAYVGLNNSAVQLGGKVDEYLVESNTEHLYFDMNTTVATMPDAMRDYLEAETGLSGTALEDDIALNPAKYYEDLFIDVINDNIVSEDMDISFTLNAFKNYCADYDADNDTCNVEYSFVLYDYEKEVNKVHVVSGRMPETGNEIAVFPEYLANTGYKIGDTLTVDGNDFEIVGTAYQSNYILPMFSVQSAFLDYDSKTAIFATSDGYAKISETSTYTYGVVFNEIKGVYDTSETIQYVKNFRGSLTGLINENTLEADYVSTVLPYYMNTSISAVFMEMDNMKTMGNTLSNVILILALVIVGFMVKKRIENDGKQLGVLKSLGYSSREIAVGYMALPLIAGLIGLTLGFLVGSVVSIPLINLLREAYLVPTDGYVFDFELIFGGFILPGLIMMGVAFIVIVTLLRTTAVDLLKPGSKMDMVREKPSTKDSEGNTKVSNVLLLVPRFILYLMSRAYNWFKFTSLTFLSKRHSKKVKKLKAKKANIDKKDKLALEKHANRVERTEHKGFITRFKYSLVLRSPGKLVSIFFTIFISSMLLVITFVGTTLVDDMMDMMAESMPYDKMYLYSTPINQETYSDFYTKEDGSEDGISLMISELTGAAPVLTNISRNGVDITPENKLVPDVSYSEIDESCVALGNSEEECTIDYDEYSQEIDYSVTVSLTGKRVEDSELAPLYNKSGDEISEKLDEGMIISDFMAAWYDLRVGDDVTIEFTYYDYSVYMVSNNPLDIIAINVVETIEIVDVTNEFFNPSAYVSYEWLNQSIGNTTEADYKFNYRYTNDLTPIEGIEKSLVLLEVNIAQTMASMEEEMEMMDIFIGIVVGIAAILSLVIVLVMTNFTIEDNFKNISLLKVMGYQDKEISKMVLRIYSPVIMIAYVLSIPVTIVVLQSLMAVLGELMGVSIPIRMKLSSAIIGAAAMMISYMIAIQISKRRISKIPLQEALKED